jgi:excisionase family DNA binding protein
MIEDEYERTQERLLTIKDVAARYQVSAATVRRWDKDGTGPACIKIGRIIRFRLEDIHAWEDRYSL